MSRHSGIYVQLCEKLCCDIRRIRLHLCVDLELYNIGFLHDTLEAEPCAIGARFAVGFGGAE